MDENKITISGENNKDTNKDTPRVKPTLKQKISTYIVIAITAILLYNNMIKGTDGYEKKEGASRKQVETEAGTYEQISGEDAHVYMEEVEDCIVLDVRTVAEFEEKHIKGAICVPNEEIKNKEPKELPKKNQLILVYCRSGNRSKHASQKLADMGYTNVKEFGGIIDWKYETE